MKQWIVLSAFLLSLNICLTYGNVMHCADDSKCPADHCCLEVGEEYICSPLPKQNESCQLERLLPTPNEDASRIHAGSCPCAMGLICSSNTSSSSSEESGNHSAEQATCRKVQTDSSESEE